MVPADIKMPAVTFFGALQAACPSLLNKHTLSHTHTLF